MCTLYCTSSLRFEAIQLTACLALITSREQNRTLTWQATQLLHGRGEKEVKQGGPKQRRVRNQRERRRQGRADVSSPHTFTPCACRGAGGCTESVDTHKTLSAQLATTELWRGPCHAHAFRQEPIKMDGATQSDRDETPAHREHARLQERGGRKRCTCARETKRLYHQSLPVPSRQQWSG